MKLHKKNKRSKQAGFSLAELMVVIVIIGLLVTLVTRNVLRNLDTAQTTTVRANIETMMQACTDYAINNGGRYPDSLEELVQRDDKGFSYLDEDEVPTDPWGNPYHYEPPDAGSTKPIIMSFGADGSRGGEGKGVDISSEDN